MFCVRIDCVLHNNLRANSSLMFNPCPARLFVAAVTPKRWMLLLIIVICYNERVPGTSNGPKDVLTFSQAHPGKTHHGRGVMIFLHY